MFVVKRKVLCPLQVKVGFIEASEPVLLQKEDHQREVMSKSICRTAHQSCAGEHERTEQVMAKSIPVIGRFKILLHAGFTLSLSAMVGK